MRDSDWSRPNLLRSDWLGPDVATMTTYMCKLYGTFFQFFLYFIYTE